MAERHPQRLVGMHLTMAAVPPVRDASMTKRDKEGMARLQQFQAEESAYGELQTTRPQTLGFALTDSPVGQAAWILERFRNWSACHGDLDSTFSRDALLANVTCYWVTAPAGSSARLYCQTKRAGSFLCPASTVPVGYADFPVDQARLPRAWIEERPNVTRWTTMPRGGHFPALEAPGDLIADARKFFGSLKTINGEVHRG
jgi:pimeloyl-ACP methyl ester carboxylesterase